MMLSLFKVDHRSILANRLVCLTENWIQWLLKDARVVVPVEGLYHYYLETFKWVID